MGVPRATHRYRGRRPAHAALRERRRALAAERPRWGYRRLAVLLTRGGHARHHKLVHRLYREEELVVRRRRKKRAAVVRVPLTAPMRPNERWAMGFARDALADGRKLRCLTIVDAFTRECPAVEVDTSRPGERVVRLIDRLVATRGTPTAITVDNGPELAGKALDAWAYRHGVSLDFITPGKPVENAYAESFNGKFRDECLDQHWLLSLPDARFQIERYRPQAPRANRTPRSDASNLSRRKMMRTFGSNAKSSRTLARPTALSGRTATLTTPGATTRDHPDGANSWAERTSAPTSSTEPTLVR